MKQAITCKYYRRVDKFRHDLQDMKVRFEATKKQQETSKNEQNRDHLLRRPNRGAHDVVKSHKNRMVYFWEI